MSSPTEFAGSSAMAPFAVSQRPSMMRFSIACPSASTLRAASPTTGSSRIAGYGPDSSHVWKNGAQSMNPASSARPGRHVVPPVQAQGVGARSGQRDQRRPFLAGVLDADLFIIGGDLGDIVVL